MFFLPHLARAFGADKRPLCPHCKHGARLSLTRNAPHPDHPGYHAQTLSCHSCVYQLQRSVDPQGLPRRKFYQRPFVVRSN